MVSQDIATTVGAGLSGLSISQLASFRREMVTPKIRRRDQANATMTSSDFRYTVGKDGSIYAICMTVGAQ
jgi:hypothetical protein